jgi:intracellular sulfur oxidation DsrE/DsrF family protein
MQTLWTLLLIFLPLATFSAEGITVEQLLTRDAAPAGVVFEIVTGDSRSLDWAIPQVQQDVDRLRTKFPGLDIAVVSHGQEQFGLTKSNDNNSKSIRQTTRSLIQNKDVTVHVCGTYAEWHGVDPEDFPDYVDVAPAGPTQINLYKEVGYEHVLVKRRK